MEYIDSIFYRKINPSDFKKMYDIDIPATGGGQTYLEAAGIDNEDLFDFLSKSEISNSTLQNETRKVYTLKGYILGDEELNFQEIEFAPRGGRRNYRIIRQNMRHKHPAWRVENGFPEPVLNSYNEYMSDPTFSGIIDNLIIYIIRTTYNRYFVSFVNLDSLPESWPREVGLEKIFEDDKRGILFLKHNKIPFINDKNTPFGNPEVGSIEEIRISMGENILLYGVPGSGKSWTIEQEFCDDETRIERLVFHPDYTYSDFVGQILPNVLEGSVTYEFTPGPFTTLLKKAYYNPDKEYYLIIEEINRGNASAIFGEIFQLLDRKETLNDDGFQIGTSQYGITHKDIAKIVYGEENKKVRIPSNMSIIATMNTSDQNVFTLDTAFQRRWEMRMLENNFDTVESSFANRPILDSNISWKKFCDVINDLILEKNSQMTSAEDKRLGVYFVKEKDLIDYTAELNENADELEIKQAENKNRRFAEKVLKYLWDDAFKFSRHEVFNIESHNSLEKIVKVFSTKEENNRFLVFKEDVYNALLNNNE